MTKNDLEIAAILGRVFVTIGIVAVVVLVAVGLGTGIPALING